MSVIAPIVALPSVDSVTLLPPVVKLLPRASFACRVMVEVEIPLAIAEAGDTLIVDCVMVATPVAKVTEVVFGIAIAFRVPDTIMASAEVFVIVAV